MNNAKNKINQTTQNFITTRTNYYGRSVERKKCGESIMRNVSTVLLMYKHAMRGKVQNVSCVLIQESFYDT